jgi:HD domain
MTSTTIRIILLAPMSVLFIIVMWRIKSHNDKSKGKRPSKPVLIPGPKQLESERKRSEETYAKLCEKNENHKKTQRELANIYRNEVNNDVSDLDAEKLFVHREIKRFYYDHVEGKPHFTGKALRATVEVLKLLDIKGKVSSVVNKNADEPEIGYEPGVYKTLKRITLYEHSVNVARELLKIVGKDSPMAPKAVIAGLCHDLGKIVQFYDKLHSTGTHPFIAISVIGKLTELQELNYLGEILDAVKNHHRTPESQLGKDLKRADQAARRLEMLEYGMDTTSSTSKPYAAPDNVAFKSGDGLPTLHLGAIDSTNKRIKMGRKPRVVADLMGTGETTLSLPPDIFGEASCTPHSKEVDLMGAGSFLDNHSRGKNLTKVKLPWFDLGNLLREINPVINRMQEGRWYAVSHEEGTVYVRPDLLFSVAVKLCDNPIEIQIAQTDLETRDNMIYTMVSKCRDDGIIETSMISEKYYGSLFLINPGTISEYEAYLTPFKAEAWKNDYLNLNFRTDIIGGNAFIYKA